MIMRRLFLLFISLLILSTGIIQAQERKSAVKFRKYNPEKAGFVADLNFKKKYLPGDTLTASFEVSWQDLQLKKIQLDFPEGFEVISGQDIGYGWSAIVPTISDDTLIIWESPNGLYDWDSPLTVELELAASETLSGNQDVEVLLIGGDWDADFETPLTKTISELPVEPSLSISSSSFDFGTLKLGTGITSGDKITLSNGGANDLVISEVANIIGDFILEDAIPLTLGAQEDYTFVIKFEPALEGMFNNEITLKSNGGDKSFTLIGTAFGDSYQNEDFERSSEQFPSAGWQMNTVEGDVNWSPNWGVAMAGDYDAYGQAELITPAVDLSSSTGKFISFNYYSDNTDGYINILYSANNGTDWTALSENINQGTGLNKEVTIDLSGVSGEQVIFKFEAIIKGSDIGIDNVVLPLYFDPKAAPLATINVFPADAETDVPIAAEFKWDRVMYANGYKLYLDTKEIPEIVYDLGDTNRFSADLEELTYYNWKVVPYNQYGDAVDCPIWNFKTEQFVPTMWSSDINENNRISFREGEEAAPKVLINDKNESFYTWFENQENRYNVRLQKLDENGTELFRRNGMLISNHPQNSWITDYDFKFDNDGNILIAFNDVRNGEIDEFVYKLNQDGEFMWSTDGIMVSEAGIDDMMPIMQFDSQNNLYIEWTADDSICYQKLDTEGNLLWASPKKIQGARGNYFIDDSDNLIITYSKDSKLYLESFDANLNANWTSAITVSDAPELPYYGVHTIHTCPDKNGGYYIAWGSARGWMASVKVQYVNKDLGVNYNVAGNYVNDNEARTQAYFRTNYLEKEDKFFITWDDQTNSQNGFYCQKFDKDGNKSYDVNGKIVMPLNDTLLGTEQVKLKGDTIVWYYACKTTPTPFDWNNYQYASFFDLEMNPIEELETIKYAGTVTNKPLQDLAMNDEMSIMLWNEERTEDEEVFTQNLFMNGQMGVLGPDETAPKPKTATVLSNEKVLIHFNEILSKPIAEFLENYSVEGKTITYAELLNPQDVLVKISDLTDGTYKLYFYNIEDMSGNAIVKDSISFDFTNDVIAPELTVAKAVSANQVVLRFSEAVAETQLIDPANYQLTEGMTINKIEMVADYQAVITMNSTLAPSFDITVNKFADLMENTVENTVKTITFVANTGSLSYFSDDFSEGISETYGMFDLDGNSPHPEVSWFTDAWMALELEGGNIAAGSNSAYSPAGQADDWLISPTINIQKNTYLVWDAMSISYNFLDSYEVYVSTTGNQPEDFKVKVFSTAEEMYEWQNRYIKLADYGFGDEEVYVAIRQTSNDKFLILIDNLRLFTPTEMDVTIKDVQIPASIMGGIEMPLRATVENVGNSQINSVEFLWQINDGTVNSETIYNLELGFGEEIVITHSDVLAIPYESGIYTLKAWFDTPNGNEDTNNENNTFTTQFEVQQGFVKRKVLLEHFTNTGCAPCATQNPVLESLLAEGNNTDNVVHITYHPAYPDAEDPFYLYNTADNGARLSHYEISGVPTVVIAGEQKTGPASVTQAQLNDEMANPGYFKVTGKSEIIGNALNIKFDIQNLKDFNGTAPIVHVVLTEDIVLETPAGNGETHFPGVMRKMFPDSKGTIINTLDSLDVTTVEFDYELSEEIITENAKVVIFIQDSETNQVYMTGNDFATSINNDINASNFSVYPNPASEKFFIELPAEGTVSIFDITGKNVYENSLPQGRNELNVSQYQKGVYILQYSTGSFANTTKIIIK